MQQDVEGGLSNEAYTDIEQQAYEAAVVPELWPTFLTTLTSITESAGALVLCANERGVHIVSDPKLAPMWQSLLTEGWGERNSRLGSAVSRGLVGIGRFVTEDDYFDKGQSEKSL